jgi:hypothetical protein
MRDVPLLSRDRVLIAMVVAVLVLFAALAATRLMGADDPAPEADLPDTPAMGDLLPLTEAEFQDALAVAVEHGNAMGTWDPEAAEDGYYERLGATADAQYADLLSAEGTAAAGTAGHLAEADRPTTGAAAPVGAPMVAEAMVTFELELRAEDAGGGEPLELGVYQVAVRRDEGEWRIAGVTDPAVAESLEGEGLI